MYFIIYYIYYIIYSVCVCVCVRLSKCLSHFIWHRNNFVWHLMKMLILIQLSGDAYAVKPFVKSYLVF